MWHLKLSKDIFHNHTSVSLEECGFFTRQLHALQKSGVPLLSSLGALNEQISSGGLKRILNEMHRDLLEGRTLSQALKRHPKVFNPVYIGLIRVGEKGGLLEQSLGQLSALFEWQIEMRQQLRQALMYPAIVVTTLCAALTVMFTFVLPRFARLFRSFSIKLPIQTRILIGLNYVLSHYGWLIGILILAAAVAWVLYIRTDAGRLRWHRWKLRLPILGPLFVELAMSRFARVTAALNRSGVSILETLALAGESVNNKYIQKHLLVIRNKVRGGEPLASALKGDALFPPVVVQMVKTGEDSGRLSDLLLSVSDYYDQQVTYGVKRLITFLEPALLVVVGLGVLVMAMAVFVPMWDLVKVLKHTGG